LIVSDKHENSDVDIIVLVDAAFVCNKNNKLRFYNCFQKQADENQHVTRIQAVFETSQTRLIRFKNFNCQRDISEIRLKIDVVSFAIQKQQVFSDIINLLYDRLCNFDIILVASSDIDYYADKILVSTVENSNIDCNVVDRSAILQRQNFLVQAIFILKRYRRSERYRLFDSDC